MGCSGARTTNDKNLNSEIETKSQTAQTSSTETPINDKNLNSEIETFQTCYDPFAHVSAINDKNLNSEIETVIESSLHQGVYGFNSVIGV